MTDMTRGKGLLEPMLADLRAQRANKLIPSSLRTGRILDIGCGTYPYFLAHTSFAEKFAIDQIPLPQQTAAELRIESFTLDLEFASWNNEIADVTKFADRISNVHIRDYNGSPVDDKGRRHYCLPGMGKTDFNFAFSELKRHDYKGIFTLEARHYSTKDINDSLDLLNNAMGKTT